MQASHDVSEMVLDLPLRHTQPLGQLSRRKTRTSEQVHETLTWCLFERVHGCIVHEKADEGE
ncbi:hypothetical protein YTPLAS18_38860 [Nitrospira sp.]|nr:hypothetical protein YTPLAS18_38860 [Nitrospira sp.]